MGVQLTLTILNDFLIWFYFRRNVFFNLKNENILFIDKKKYTRNETSFHSFIINKSWLHWIYQNNNCGKCANKFGKKRFIGIIRFIIVYVDTNHKHSLYKLNQGGCMMDGCMDRIGWFNLILEPLLTIYYFPAQFQK